MDIRKSLSIGILLAAGVSAQTALTDKDRADIQALMGQYSQALGSCNGAGFADLFTPNGIFASGFRGRMTGRDRLIKLVESERQCTNPTKGGAAARPGGAAGPTVNLEVTASGVRGIANLGTAEYEDEYVKTAQGWRFASRAVITGPEKAAGLSAAELIAIEKLTSKLGDRYEPDQNGVQRLMTTGVRVTVANGQVTGRAFLAEGSYDDNIYEKAGPGQWKVKSSTHVAGK